MLPINGPFIQNRSSPPGTTLNSYRARREIYRQKKPYDQPAPYRAYYVKTVQGFGELRSSQADSSFSSGYWQNGGGPALGLNDGWLLADSINMAAERLRDAVHKKALLSVDWHQRQQAVDMIAGRASQLLTFTNSIRKGAWKDAAGALNLNNRKRSRDRVKARDLGDTWLEYWFGWKPLISDIYDAVDILQSPLDGGEVEVYAKGSQNLRNVDSSAYVEYVSTLKVKYKVKCGLTYHVTNPVLYWANQLGLVNPTEVAWDAIPYSFVVDWFTNVGDFLSSMTDWVGLATEKPWTSMKYSYSNECHTTRASPGFDQFAFTKASEGYQRVLGVPSVKLRVRLPAVVKPTRAATAISLLLQHMRSI